MAKSHLLANQSVLQLMYQPEARGGFFKTLFLLRSNLAATFSGHVHQVFWINFLQRLTSVTLSNEHLTVKSGPNSLISDQAASWQ